MLFYATACSRNYTFARYQLFSVGTRVAQGFRKTYDTALRDNESKSKFFFFMCGRKLSSSTQHKLCQYLSSLNSTALPLKHGKLKTLRIERNTITCWNGKSRKYLKIFDARSSATSNMLVSINGFSEKSFPKLSVQRNGIIEVQRCYHLYIKIIEKSLKSLLLIGTMINSSTRCGISSYHSSKRNQPNIRLDLISLMIEH